MPKNFLTSGAFAKLCRTSKDTLFHYDRVGLFKPAWVDENGYRHYHVLQYDTFLTIRQLHALGMPLADIKSYMDKRTPARMTALLREQENRLAQQIEQLQQIQRRLCTQRQRMEAACAHPRGETFVATLPARAICCTEWIQPPDDAAMTQQVAALIAAADDKRAEPVLGMCCDKAAARKNPAAPCRFYLYGESAETHTILRPGGDYLHTFHYGSYETLHTTIQFLCRDADARGVATDDTVYIETVIGDWAVQSPADYVMTVALRLT